MRIVALLSLLFVPSCITGAMWNYALETDVAWSVEDREVLFTGTEVWTDAGTRDNGPPEPRMWIRVEPNGIGGEGISGISEGPGWIQLRLWDGQDWGMARLQRILRGDSPLLPDTLRLVTLDGTNDGVAWWRGTFTTEGALDLEQLRRPATAADWRASERPHGSWRDLLMQLAGTESRPPDPAATFFGLDVADAYGIIGAPAPPPWATIFEPGETAHPPGTLDGGFLDGQAVVFRDGEEDGHVLEGNVLALLRQVELSPGVFSSRWRDTCTVGALWSPTGPPIGAQQLWTASEGEPAIRVIHVQRTTRPTTSTRWGRLVLATLATPVTAVADAAVGIGIGAAALGLAIFVGVVDDELDDDN